LINFLNDKDTFISLDKYLLFFCFEYSKSHFSSFYKLNSLFCRKSPSMSIAFTKYNHYFSSNLIFAPQIVIIVNSLDVLYRNALSRSLSLSPLRVSLEVCPVSEQNVDLRIFEWLHHRSATLVHRQYGFLISYRTANVLNAFFCKLSLITLWYKKITDKHFGYIYMHLTMNLKPIFLSRSDQ